MLSRQVGESLVANDLLARPAMPRQAIVAQLRETLDRAIQRPATATISSGCAELDRQLPAGGFRAGSLVEWLGEVAAGATTLALLAVKAAAQGVRPVVVVDERGTFYAPAAAALGFDMAQLVIVTPRNRRDADWATHQALASPAVAALVAWPAMVDDRMFRRFQLAAEKANVLGCFIRPPQARASPTWADVRLGVESVCDDDTTGANRVNSRSVRRFRIEMLHCRGGRHGASLELELDDETHALHLASPLAAATSVPRSAGA